MRRCVRSAVTMCGGALLALLLSGGPASGTTFYVRKSGNDANTGRSPERAFLTVGRAASEPGSSHVIIVGPGRYPEEVSELGGSGRPDAPLVFFADRTGAFTGDPAGEVVVDAEGFQNGFRISARPWVVINGFTIVNARHAIVLKSGCDSCVAANNVLIGSRERGLLVENSAGVIVFNNLVTDNQGTGIDLDASASGSLIINNTIYGNGVNGVRIEGGSNPSTGIVVLNNIVAANHRSGINVQAESTAGFLGQWNLNVDGYTAEGVTRGALDLRDPPSFVAPEDRVFALRQVAAGHDTDSAAVNASGVRARTLGLGRASTRTDGKRDRGQVDLGYHQGSTADLLTTLRGNGTRGPRFVTSRRLKKRLARLLALAERCEGKAGKARALQEEGRGACAAKGRRKQFARQCGQAALAVCE